MGDGEHGTNIYIASANSNKTSYKLISGEEVTWGFWSAVEASTARFFGRSRIDGRYYGRGALSVANAWLTRDRLTLPDTCSAEQLHGQDSLEFATGGSVIDGRQL